MRKITWWIMSTLTALTLLFTYHTSTSSTPASPPAATAAEGNTAGAGDTAETADTADTAASGAVSGTFTGSVANTRWGPVQVAITVVAGKITAADAVVVPDENSKDVAINNRAIPVLEQQTVSAQSANIDMVSGATVTSTGYVQSLQSAIDQANL